MMFLVVESGSSVEKECTKETDRKCQCRGEFVPKDNDSSTCICNVGFGLKGRGTEMDHTTEHAICQKCQIAFLMINSFSLPECSKCEHGYFSISINSPCQQWKEYVHCIVYKMWCL